MTILWEELSSGFPDSRQVLRLIIRLLAATILGAAVGFQRELTGKPAGLRTHTLVTLGTAVLVICCGAAGMSSDGFSRVIQGIVTGIGFVGAGSILKVSEEHMIHGLTTAASIWLVAGVGVAAGLGKLGIALLATVLALIILSGVGAVEHRIQRHHERLRE